MKMISCLRRHLPAIVLAMPLLVAAQGFPERELTLTVIYGPGGNTDIVTRILAKHMEPTLGKAVVVQNRPGAGGAIGIEHVARQAPDGYNIGIVTGSTLALVPHLNKVRYSVDDFEYIGGFAAPRLGIAVRADTPYKTLADLIEQSKTKDGKSLFFGSGATLNTLFMYELNRNTGSNFEVVNYKSGAEVVTALLGGQVTVAVLNPSDVVQHAQAGKMRLLASASGQRWPEFPDVPTIRDLGYKFVGGDSWLGVVAPKGTPRAALDKLRAAVAVATANAEFKAAMSANGVYPLEASGAELERFMREASMEMGRVAERAGMTPNQASR